MAKGRGPDLFAAAVEERLARQGAARGAAAAAHARRGRRPAAPARPGQAAAGAHRVRPAVVGRCSGGRPAPGKTTIARLVAGRHRRRRSRPLSAVSAGVKDVREVAERARARLGEHGQGTILFLDEVHRFSRAQQDVLLPHVEEGLLVLIGATTENPFFSLTGPLLSRSTLFRLEPLDDDDLRELAATARSPTTNAASATKPLDDRRRRARAPRRHAAKATRATCSPCSRSRTRSRSKADRDDDHARRRRGRARAAQRRYGDDEHYDIISAFIKSIRGSDPDAGLYWLARMLEAGEDARFIARRLVILASRGRRHGRPAARSSSPTRPRARSSTSGCPRRAQPRARGDPPGARAEVEQRDRPRSARRPTACATAAPGRCRCICGTPTTVARRCWATARATSILTTRRRDGCRRSTCPPRWRASGSTDPSAARRRARAVRRLREATATRRRSTSDVGE